MVSWLMDKPVEIRPVWESKINTAAQIALAGFALGVRALRRQPAAHANRSRMDGRRDDLGLRRRLYRPVARSHEPIAAIMIESLVAVSLLVPDYDEGLAFFGALGSPSRRISIGAESAGSSWRRPEAAGHDRAGGSGRRAAACAYRRPDGRAGRLFLLTDSSRGTMPRCVRGVTFLEAPRTTVRMRSSSIRGAGNGTSFSPLLDIEKAIPA